MKTHFSNKSTLLILFLILIMLLTSCQGQQGGGTIFTDYHIGTKGLEVTFIKEAPPQEVFETSGFEIQALIRNYGAHDIVNKSAATLTIIPSAKQYYNKITQGYTTKDLQFFGKSLNYPEGEMKHIELLKLKTEPITGNFELIPPQINTFDFKLCYPYETHFADDVCIDTDLNGDSLRQQVCKAQAKTYGSGQGAPIAVTEIIPKMIPVGPYVKPEYVIKIANVGKGSVFAPGIKIDNTNLETCHPSAQSNIIYINATLQGQQLNCVPTNIKLKDGIGQTKCYFEDSQVTQTTSNFVTSITVDLSYNYEQSYKKSVAIKRRYDLKREQTADKTDLLLPYQVFSEDEEQIINLCDYCAIHPDFNACKPNKKDNDQKDVKTGYSCLYNFEDCKDNSNVCIIRKGLCDPYTYCGLPKCINNNKKPMVRDVKQTYPPSGEISWTCLDSNEYDDTEHLCGCSNEAAYAFVNQSKDCDNTELEWTKVTSLNLNVPFFSVPIDYENNQYACLRVIDNQGLSSQIDDVELMVLRK